VDGDLGKTVFQLVAFNLRGEVVVRKKFSRTQPLHFSAKVHVQLASKPAGVHIFLAGLCENRPLDATRFQVQVRRRIGAHWPGTSLSAC